MKKTHLKLFFAAMALFLIAPQMVLAAWWNPFTWKIFARKETTQQVQVETKKDVPAMYDSETIQAEIKRQVEAELKAKAEQDAFVIKQESNEPTKMMVPKIEESQKSINSEASSYSDQTRHYLEQVEKERVQQINYQKQKEALKESKECKEATVSLEENKNKKKIAQEKSDSYYERYKKSNDNSAFLKYMEYSREASNLATNQTLLLSEYYRFCEGSSVLPEIPKVYNTTCYNGYGTINCTTY